MPKRHTEAVMHSSARSDWRTPPELFQALDEEFIFDLDLAADANSTLVRRGVPPVDCWLGPGSALAEDALAIGWTKIWEDYDRCIGFMNPPYDKTHPIGPWIEKAWIESQRGCTIVGIIPFSPQTRWYRKYIYGHILDEPLGWNGHAAMEERRLPHRETFLRPDGTEAHNAPGNTVIIVWRPNPGYVGPWQPAVRYWSYR